MAASKYTALTPIEHDGKRFEIGTVLSLEPKHAEPLLALKAIEPKAQREASTKPPSTGAATEGSGTGEGEPPADNP